MIFEPLAIGDEIFSIISVCIGVNLFEVVEGQDLTHPLFSMQLYVIQHKPVCKAKEFMQLF